MVAGGRRVGLVVGGRPGGMWAWPSSLSFSRRTQPASFAACFEVRRLHRRRRRSRRGRPARRRWSSRCLVMWALAAAARRRHPSDHGDDPGDDGETDQPGDAVDGIRRRPPICLAASRSCRAWRSRSLSSSLRFAMRAQVGRSDRGRAGREEKGEEGERRQWKGGGRVGDACAPTVAKRAAPRARRASPAPGSARRSGFRERRRSAARRTAAPRKRRPARTPPARRPPRRRRPLRGAAGSRRRRGRRCASSGRTGDRHHPGEDRHLDPPPAPPATKSK